MANKSIAAFFLVILSISCISKVPSEANYIVLEGTLEAAPGPEASGTRLFFYLRIEEKIVVCLARNKAREDILRELHFHLRRAMTKNIVIYALPVQGTIEEIAAGVDYEVHAVGVWIPEASKRRLILTGYGDSFIDSLKTIKWTEFIQKILGKGVDSI